jgi:hypothetical protein
MKTLIAAPSIALAILLLAAGCGDDAPAVAVEPPAADTAPAQLEGPVLRADIEAAEPGWVNATLEADLDEQAVAELAAVEPGATVDVYLGTWCPDSRRELSRFWATLDALDTREAERPFEVHYVAVAPKDRRDPAVTAEVDLRAVPTFVVSRDGEEIGRVVESAPHGIETDLLRLLRGDASGAISGRAELAD